MKKQVICLIVAMLALCSQALAQHSYAPIEPTEEQRYAAGLFLSNFTEVGCRTIGTDSPDEELVDFAHDHLWMNAHDSFEYGEFDNGNNCRVADDRIQEIVDHYIFDARTVDLQQTRFDCADGYYYHCDTGGWVPDGYALVTSICPAAEENQYFISFVMYGAGYDWTNDDIRLSSDESAAKYGFPCGYGSALVHAENLADRETYFLISFARV